MSRTFCDGCAYLSDKLCAGMTDAEPCEEMRAAQAAGVEKALRALWEETKRQCQRNIGDGRCYFPGITVYNSPCTFESCPLVAAARERMTK